jgi:hypothetical protein
MIRTILLIAALWIALDIISQEVVLNVFAPIDDDLWSGIASSVHHATE